MPLSALIKFLAPAVIAGFAAIYLPAGYAETVTPLDTFDEAVTLVTERFFDPDMNGLDWEREVTNARNKLVDAADGEALVPVLNELFAKLEASHMEAVSRDDPRWFQLAGVFVDGYEPLREALEPYLTDSAPVYSGIGVMLSRRDHNWFVSGVLNGFPAADSGILVGDRLVSVDGESFHPIRSFAGKIGQTVRMVVERAPGESLELDVVPEQIDGRSMFETAMRESAHVTLVSEARVGYIRAWSYAGRRYQDIVTGQLINGSLKDADVLVLDLRGGWGGADPSYLNFFSPDVVTAVSTTRSGEQNRFTSGWSKPVVLLVDGGSRSGKELFAYGFRSLRKGPIVGETTAGAVLSGQINALADGTLLYVAVADVEVDGHRLEGVGVKPDIEVPFDLPYAAGRDPQLDCAVQVAVTLVHSAGKDRVSADSAVCANAV